MLEINKVHNMDCIEGMKLLEDESIDLIITDPPFNISQKGRKIKRDNIENRRLRKLIGRKSAINYDFGEWDRQWKNKEEYLEWTKKWVKECYRVLKPCGQIYSFFSRKYISFFEEILEEVGFHVRQTMVWHKTNPVPQLFKVGYMSACEFITWATKNKGSGHIFNYKLGQQHNVIEAPVNRDTKISLHPCQKPLRVLEVFVKYSSNEGNLILDPFSGSGMTAIACLKNSRNFIGFDISEDYCKIANELIKKWVMQRKLTEWKDLYMS